MNQAVSVLYSLMVTVRRQIEYFSKRFSIEIILHWRLSKITFFSSYFSEIKENRRHVSESNLSPTKVILQVNIFFLQSTFPFLIAPTIFMILFTHVIRETAQFSSSLYIVITEYKYAIKFTLSPLGPEIKIEFILCFVKRMCICLECSG